MHAQLQTEILEGILPLDSLFVAVRVHMHGHVMSSLTDRACHLCVMHGAHCNTCVQNSKVITNRLHLVAFTHA